MKLENVPIKIKINIHDCPICDTPLVCDIAYIDDQGVHHATREAYSSRRAADKYPGHEDKQAVVLSLYCPKDRILFRP